MVLATCNISFLFKVFIKYYTQELFRWLVQLVVHLYEFKDYNFYVFDLL